MKKYIKVEVKYNCEAREYYLKLDYCLSRKIVKKIESLYMNSFGLIVFSTKKEAEEIKSKILEEVR
jgi:hypothetical protein